MILAFWWVPSSARAQAEVSLAKCQAQVGILGANFIMNHARAISNCLKKISVELIKKNAADVSKAANTCIAQFRKINDTRGLGKSLEEKFLAKVDTKCDPATNDHTLADLLGTGAGVPQPISVENLDTWCQNFGGDGAIDDLDEWMDCIVASHTCEANQAIPVQYPRVLEWLDDVKPFMQAVTPPGADPDKVDDAVAALDALDLSLDADGDDALDITCGPAPAYPATGKTSSSAAGDDQPVRDTIDEDRTRMPTHEIPKEITAKQEQILVGIQRITATHGPGVLPKV